MINQRGFVGVYFLIGLVILAGIGGVYYWQKSQVLQLEPTTPPILTPTKQPVNLPSVDETANWKTYTNDGFGISIKYPPYYTFKSLGPNLFQEQLNKGQQISGTIAPSYEDIEFIDNEHPERIFILSFYHQVNSDRAKNLDFPFNSDCGSQFADKTDVNRIKNNYGFPYREVAQTMHDSWRRTAYCFLNQNNNLIVLKVENVQPSYVEEINKILPQILSTLKFIEQSQPQGIENENMEAPINLTRCASGDKSLRVHGLGSGSLVVSGRQGNNCVLKYTNEIEGGYTIYECILPVTIGEITGPMLDVAKFCQEKESGSFLLSR